MVRAPVQAEFREDEIDQGQDGQEVSALEALDPPGTDGGPAEQHGGHEQDDQEDDGQEDLLVPAGEFQLVIFKKGVDRNEEQQSDDEDVGDRALEPGKSGASHVDRKGVRILDHGGEKHLEIFHGVDQRIGEGHPACPRFAELEQGVRREQHVEKNDREDPRGKDRERAEGRAAQLVFPVFDPALCRVPGRLLSGCLYRRALAALRRRSPRILSCAVLAARPRRAAGKLAGPLRSIPVREPRCVDGEEQEYQREQEQVSAALCPADHGRPDGALDEEEPVGGLMIRPQDAGRKAEGGEQHRDIIGIGAAEHQRHRQKGDPGKDRFPDRRNAHRVGTGYDIGDQDQDPPQVHGRRGAQFQELADRQTDGLGQIVENGVVLHFYIRKIRNGLVRTDAVAPGCPFFAFLLDVIVQLSRTACRVLFPKESPGIFLHAGEVLLRDRALLPGLREVAGVHRADIPLLFFFRPEQNVGEAVRRQDVGAAVGRAPREHEDQVDDPERDGRGNEEALRGHVLPGCHDHDRQHIDAQKDQDDTGEPIAQGGSPLQRQVEVDLKLLRLCRRVGFPAPLRFRVCGIFSVFRGTAVFFPGSVFPVPEGVFAAGESAVFRCKELLAHTDPELFLLVRVRDIDPVVSLREQFPCLCLRGADPDPAPAGSAGQHIRRLDGPVKISLLQVFVVQPDMDALGTAGCDRDGKLDGGKTAQIRLKGLLHRLAGGKLDLCAPGRKGPDRHIAHDLLEQVGGDRPRQHEHKESRRKDPEQADPVEADQERRRRKEQEQRDDERQKDSRPQGGVLHRQLIAQDTVLRPDALDHALRALVVLVPVVLRGLREGARHPQCDPVESLVILRHRKVAGVVRLRPDLPVKAEFPIGVVDQVG